MSLLPFPIEKSIELLVSLKQPKAACGSIPTVLSSLPWQKEYGAEALLLYPPACELFPIASVLLPSACE